MTSAALTADQQDEFRTTGLLRLEGARVGRVVELTGEPGDVVVMHSDCFHAAAPNRLAEPRMMLTGMIESMLSSPERS
jgi:ectoine hydroxylase-related dioxygenase (phytanoyl-CoA dioxygenase family)